MLIIIMTMMLIMTTIPLDSNYDNAVNNDGNFPHQLPVFGGAGGQHACAIARSLGISKVFVHKYASVLSAYGLSGAELVEENQAPAATILMREGGGGR